MKIDYRNSSKGKCKSLIYSFALNGIARQFMYFIIVCVFLCGLFFYNIFSRQSQKHFHLNAAWNFISV